MSPIQRACEIIPGGQKALADALSVSPSAVNQWVRGVRPVPIDRMTDIERLTGGAVTRRDLCPEWRRIWPELETAPPAQEAA